MGVCVQSADLLSLSKGKVKRAREIQAPKTVPPFFGCYVRHLLAFKPFEWEDNKRNCLNGRSIDVSCKVRTRFSLQEDAKCTVENSEKENMCHILYHV